MRKLSFIWIIAVYLECLNYSLGDLTVLNLPEGSKCKYDKYNGTCTKDYLCLSMIKNIQRKTVPPICSFGEETPIVCCTDCNVTETNDIRKAVNSRAVGLLFKNGRKAHDKCIEYLMDYPYECKDHNSVTYDFKWDKNLRCTSYDVLGVAPVGGENAVRGEFPHMALLGYGPDEKSLEWLCGGSLISDRFILTAGHCISSSGFGPVTYVSLGILERSDPPELWRMYKVKRIIPHPDYISPSTYHDIALLETETLVKIDTLVIPACLHVNGFPQDSVLTATGWGKLGNRKPLADTLQKVELEQITDEDCGYIYPYHRHFREGYDNETQMCFRQYSQAKDTTCTGDSGGPLQGEVREGCQFEIVGVASEGLACGDPGGAGLYTRVEHYVSWIESIVWP